MNFKTPKIPKGGPVYKLKAPTKILGKFGISAGEVTSIQQNLVVLQEHLTEKAVLIMAWILIDLLNRSQGIVPHDTGQLKESGTAVVYFGGRYGKPVATGTADENSLATIDLSNLKGRINKTVKFISGDVFYYRFNEKGQDIALWAHEDLNPHGMGSPAVRKPGRSPKYLEIPYAQEESKYLDWIQDTFSHDEILNDMKKMRRFKKVAKGRYEVDLITLQKMSIGAVGLPKMR